MKAVMLITGNGPLVILTSYRDIEAPAMLSQLAAKGIEKFIALDIPLDLAKQRYAGHFDAVMRNLNETNDLRVLDYNGQRAFNLFGFDEIGPPRFHDRKLRAVS